MIWGAEEMKKKISQALPYENLDQVDKKLLCDMSKAFTQKNKWHQNGAPGAPFDRP